MPFFACRECGAEISAEDQFCPRCGVPRPVSFDSGGFGAALDRGVERVRMAAKIALASFVVLAVAAAGVSIRAAAREAAATEELAQKAAEARANVFVAVRDSLIERASLAVGGSEFTQALSILGPWQDLGDPVVDSLVSIARPAARSERRRAERAERAERAMAALPQWRTFESVDKMTGNRSHSALSPRAKAAKTMGFPYRGTEAWLGFGCGGSSEWAYVGFSQAPNITNDDTKDGYSTSRSRVRWDDNVVTLGLSQDWGSEFMHFQSDAGAISKILTSSTMLLELDWYGEGMVYFEFTLNGSSRAISAARAKCRGG
jgi:zinc ribbon protein